MPGDARPSASLRRRRRSLHRRSTRPRRLLTTSPTSSPGSTATQCRLLCPDVLVAEHRAGDVAIDRSTSHRRRTRGTDPRVTRTVRDEVEHRAVPRRARRLPHLGLRERLRHRVGHRSVRDHRRRRPGATGLRDVLTVLGDRGDRRPGPVAPLLQPDPRRAGALLRRRPPPAAPGELRRDHRRMSPGSRRNASTISPPTSTSSSCAARRPNTWSGTSASTLPTGSRSSQPRQRVSQLVDQLHDRTDPTELQYARQHARAIVGWHRYYDDESLLSPVREQFIADSIEWWQRLTRDTIVYWAANVHTAAASSITYRTPFGEDVATMAGGHLERHLARRYVSIGLAFGHGAITSDFQDPGPTLDRTATPRSARRHARRRRRTHVPARTPAALGAASGPTLAQRGERDADDLAVLHRSRGRVGVHHDRARTGRRPSTSSSSSRGPRPAGSSGRHERASSSIPDSRDVSPSSSEPAIQGRIHLDVVGGQVRTDEAVEAGSEELVGGDGERAGVPAGVVDEGEVVVVDGL